MHSKFGSPIKKAGWALGVIALGYSALFLVPEALCAPERAQWVIAVLLPPFVVAAFAGVRAAGLWRLSGLAWVRGGAARPTRPTRAWEAALPCALALLIPVVNVIGGWEAASGAASSVASDAANSAANSAANASLAACIIVACAALIEELCFRGLLIGALSMRDVRPLANVGITSAIFAALHAFNVGTLDAHLVAVQCALALFLGATLGFVRLSLQNLYPCLIVHVLINLTATATTLYNESLLWIELALACVACASSYVCWRRRATHAQGTSA